MLSTVSNKCEQCYRFGRSYDLASPVAEIDRLAAQEEKLRQEVLEAEAKAIRLKRKLKLARRRLRTLDNQESLNITELERDALLAEPGPDSEPAPRVSPDPAGFFLIPPQGSPGRTSLVPTGSS
jgi:hypothetical protein